MKDEEKENQIEVLLSVKLPQLDIKLSRKDRWKCFGIILSIVFVMNMDQGIVSGTTTELMEAMRLTEKELGMFGSILFIGTTLGCVLSFTLINKFDRKKLLLITIALNAGALFLLTITTNYVLLLICRFLSGFSLSFLSIYTPVWCDQFGIRKSKSFMIALVHVTSPFGYIGGYALGICFNWRVTFYIQVAMLIAQFPIILLFTNTIYYSKNLLPKKRHLELKEKSSRTTMSQSENGNSNVNTNANVNAINDNSDGITNEQIEEDDNISVFEDIIIQENKDVSKESIWTEIKVCFKSPVFIFTNLALAIIYLIVSGIQFWCNDYMEDALYITNKNTRLAMFATVSATSPTLGIIISGLVTTKVGGYETKHSVLIPLLSCFIVGILSNIVVAPNNEIAFSIYFWLYLFFGSVCLPPMTGIILTSVPTEYAGPANSLSTLFSNVAGKFPAPYLYGVLKSYTPDYGKKFPMVCLLNSAFFGVIFMILAAVFRYRSFAKPLNLSKEIVDHQDEKDSNQNNQREPNTKSSQIQPKIYEVSSIPSNKEGETLDTDINFNNNSC